MAFWFVVNRASILPEAFRRLGIDRPIVVGHSWGTLVALALGWDPHPGYLAAFLAIVAGTAAFAALGLFVAGVLRAEATLAAANLIYLLLLAGGAVVLPPSAYGAYGNVTDLLPSGALGNALRAAFWSGDIAWSALLVLLVWAAAGAVLTARTFKWE